MEFSGSDLILHTFRGVLALSGQFINTIARNTMEENPSLFEALSKPAIPYHVTLITKDELRDLPQDGLATIPTTVDKRNIYSAGLGGTRNVFFVVIIWAAGQQIRKRLGLGPKHFHITLSPQDDHHMNKGIESLFPNQLPHNPPFDFLDHLTFTLHAFGDYNRADDFSKKLILASPSSYRGFVRLGDAALSRGAHKLAMLSYACAYDRSDGDRAQSYSLKKITKCSRHTEWGPTILDEELDQIPDELAQLLLAPWSPALQSAVSNSGITPTLQLKPRQLLSIPLGSFLKSKPDSFYKLPRFFRWFIPYHSAIMSTPRCEDDIAALASPYLGIRHVLTLTAEQPLEESWFRQKAISNTFLPIPNFHPPSLEQMDLIISLFDDKSKLPLLIHCGGGKGRAGTVAACYAAAFGFRKPHPSQTHPELSAQDAVSLIRHIRPGSIETSQQVFVSKWCSTIWKRHSVYPERHSEPLPCPLIIERSSTPEANHNLFVLVGLPGSGKSWFSRSLLARDPLSWTLISQDDSGSRASCEDQIGRTPKGRVILDRCNTAASDRKRWLELAMNWSISPVCIWFDYDSSLCASRAQMRTNHPTLPPGSRVRNAIEQMQKVFVQPTLAEGYDTIFTVRSFAASQELVTRLSPTIQIHKFPRTPHLLNLGAVAPDDVFADVPAPPFHDQVVITEKIDGANMGFSLAPDRSRIVVQNRSHFVDSSTHEQFKKLGVWVESHQDDLYKILDRDPYFAERYILFGEWMYATHSIAYTRLPDYFIAFDLYDRSAEIWADRSALSHILTRTSISLVPVLYTGRMPTAEEFGNMVRRPSNFYEGRVEGIYVKVERNGRVLSRGKVVRGDFIAGNDHWTKSPLRTNGIGSPR